jgi:glycosyltransferase involved in cell wall biosynthesis
LHVMQMIDALSMGGAERLLITFAQQARLHHVQVTIVGFQDDRDNPILVDLQKTGVNIQRYPARSLFSLRRFIEIVRLVRREKVDILQTHLTYANILGGLVGWLTGVPVVATLHSTYFRRQGRGGLKDGIECWILRNIAQDVVAVAQSVADSYHPYMGNKPIRVIRNAVAPAPVISLQQVHRTRSEFSIPAESLLILAVGRAEAAKGYADLVDAVALLRRSHPTVRLVVIGNGSRFDQLVRYVVAKKMKGIIQFIGERKDVPAWLAASDIFVSSSHWEGLPLAVLEAMMAGLPIVATRVGELPQVVNSELGILVPPRHPKMLSEALAVMLDDPDTRRRMGQAAREAALRDNTASSWFRNIMAMYSEILKKKRVKRS